MTPLFKKLNFKNQANILCLNAPATFDVELMAMSVFAPFIKNEKELAEITFALIFVTKQAEIDGYMAEISPKIKEDAVIWFCYPKGSSKKYKCEFNRDNGWSGLGKYNLEPVRQVAIDEDWSALRFRKVEYIKTLTRNFAISEEGKKRTNKKEN